MRVGLRKYCCNGRRYGAPPPALPTGVTPFLPKQPAGDTPGIVPGSVETVADDVVAQKSGGAGALVAGAGAGFLVGGPVGAAVGAAAGWLLGRSK